MLFPNSEPINGFIETGGIGGYEVHDRVHHNVSATPAEEYPKGTIISYYNRSLKGYGACGYYSCTEASTDAIVIGDVVTLTAGSHTDVTNDASAGAVGDYAAEAGVPAGIAMSGMTTTYYGWFWIFGVCPDLYISATAKLAEQDDITSAGSIGAMSPFIASTTDGNIALHNRDAANNDVSVMGMSHTADSTNANLFGSIRLFGYGWGI